jgi:hypothetical protein
MHLQHFHERFFGRHFHRLALIMWRAATIALRSSATPDDDVLCGAQSAPARGASV